MFANIGWRTVHPSLAIMVARRCHLWSRALGRSVCVIDALRGGVLPASSETLAETPRQVVLTNRAPSRR